MRRLLLCIPCHFLVWLPLIIAIACSSRIASADVAIAYASTIGGNSPIPPDEDRDPDSGNGLPFLSYSASAAVPGAVASASTSAASGSTFAYAKPINTNNAIADIPHDAATAAIQHTDFLNLSSFVPNAFYAYFDVNVHGSLSASGVLNPLDGNVLASSFATAKVIVGAQANINQFINDPLNWEAGAPRAVPGGGLSTLEDVPVNFSKTYQLPYHFTHEFLISINLESVALVNLRGLTPASDLPNVSARSNLADTVRWGNLRMTDFDGNPVPFTVTSQSGYDWTQPIVPETSSALLAFVAIGILLSGPPRLRKGRPRSILS